MTRVQEIQELGECGGAGNVSDGEMDGDELLINVLADDILPDDVLSSGSVAAVEWSRITVPADPFVHPGQPGAEDLASSRQHRTTNQFIFRLNSVTS